MHCTPTNAIWNTPFWQRPSGITSLPLHQDAPIGRARRMCNPCTRGALTVQRRPPGSQIMERKKSWLREDLDALRLQWDMLTFYERFEQLVTHVLSVVISIIILVSLWQLIRAVISLLVSDALNPLDHAVFQTIFGMVMTLLIALEFNIRLRA